MLHLELFGKVNSRYEHLKHILLQKLNDASVDVSIHETHDVQQFIEENVRSIPAIRINHEHIYECKDGADINNFTEMVVGDILERESRDGGTILVPLDLMTPDNAAIAFAANLASERSLDIQLLHVHHPRPHEVDGTVVLDQDAHQKLCAGLEAIIEPLQARYPKVRFSHLVEQGFAAEVIIKASKENKVKFLVLSTQGENTLLKKWIGGVSKQVAREAQCPTFLIPPNFSGEVTNMLFATSNVEEDQYGLKIIQRVANALDANVNVVHVYNKKAPVTSGVSGQPDVIDDLGPGFQWSEVYHDDITEGILQASSDLNAEIIVMANKKKHFWTKLTQKSITKDLLQRMDNKAILVVHL